MQPAAAPRRLSADQNLRPDQDKYDFLSAVELPGIYRSKLDLEVKETAILLRGLKTVDYGPDASLRRLERLHGEFDRTIEVPIEIDACQIKAKYREGVLAIRLPKAEATGPRTVAMTEAPPT